MIKIFARVLFQIILCICSNFASTEDIILTETCNGDIFRPICTSQGEAVLMSSAIYGRPKIGRCISQKEVSALGHDTKYFGCSTDVLSILHEKCSLQSLCSIRLPDDNLDKLEPCVPGLKLYLQTEYKCIKIVTEMQDCRIQVYSIPRYLASKTILNHSQCGRQNNPWIMEAPRGQKIKLVIEMLDESKDNALSGMTCGEEFGNVIEKHQGTRKNVTMCTNGFEVISEQHRREQINTWTSSGSLLELTFNSEFIKSYRSSSKLPLILLKIESDGCLDIIPPEDTWLKRTGDDIVIGCYSSKQTWYLRCENKKWSGIIENCSINRQPVSLDEESLRKAPIDDKISEEQQIVLFVAICALGLVICLIIVCVGAICIKKYKWKTKNDAIYNKPPAYYHNAEGVFNNQLIDSHYKSVDKQMDQNNCELFGENNIPEKPEDNKYFVLEEN